ncbi:MAG: prephenate dehydratase [Firmicutes bacterium HGW-Firmicutes-12]|jgi:prephenate dehydratase|nr:MAG: prephenate dehydratase [Firmicutes bacterium HGW-Firmicutes-12]
MTSKIGYLGPEGTFSQQAAIHQLESLPSDSSCLRAYPTIALLLSAVDSEDVQYGVVPAENSIEGSVNITLDMLANELNLYIHKEIVLGIKHHLLTYAPTLNKIHTVMSHPHALAQCRLFLQKKLPHANLVDTNSTSEAVLKVSSKSIGTAAIASKNCHLVYQVPILAENIGDFSHNQTRFWVVGKQPSLLEKTLKTSLVLSMEKDRPGSLYNTLGEFAKHNINLTRIESRPAKKELGNYIFFIDCEAGQDNPGLKQVLDTLCKKTSFLKILGSYNISHY